MVQLGLAPNRSKAQAMILGGIVYSRGKRVEKAGAPLPESAEMEVRGSGCRFVSRGGLKLEAALLHFQVPVEGTVVADIGASTGGFTHCLLEFGARKVYAVDVGYGQLDWSLRNDPRVVVFEKTNARYLTSALFDEPLQGAVIDASFISLTLLIPPLLKILSSEAWCIALIKPQFEVGKGEVGKGGVVRDVHRHVEVVTKIEEFLVGLECHILGVIDSPILGPKGNKEFLIAFQLSGAHES